MKAEHRKELQTNTLADNLGRMIQGSRSMSRRTVLIVLLVVGLGLGFWIWRVISASNVTTIAESYYVIDQGNWREMQELVQGGSDTGPAKAARFQIAWLLLWKEGIEPLAAQPMQAKRGLDEASKLYQGLAELVEGDPILTAEAHYAIALIEETLVATDPTAASRAERMANAIKLYGQVASEYEKTAHGKQAKERADYLEKNRAQVLAFYDQMAGRSPPDIAEFIRQFQQKQKDQQQKEQKDSKEKK